MHSTLVRSPPPPPPTRLVSFVSKTEVGPTFPPLIRMMMKLTPKSPTIQRLMSCMMSVMMDNQDGKVRAGQVLKEINKVELLSCLLFLMLSHATIGGDTFGFERFRLTILEARIYPAPLQSRSFCTIRFVYVVCSIFHPCYCVLGCAGNDPQSCCCGRGIGIFVLEPDVHLVSPCTVACLRYVSLHYEC